MSGALDIAESAWTGCVHGEMAQCLSDLQRLQLLRGIDDAHRNRVERVLDNVAALLPQRLAAACGVATEAQCLALLNGPVGRGLIEGVAEYEALGAALMHGLHPPLQASELNEDLVEWARDRARSIDDPGLHPIFADTFGSESLACFVTLLSPRAIVGRPGNLTARVYCASARGRARGAWADWEVELWLQSGLQIIGSEGPGVEHGADARAAVHMHIAGLDTLYRLAAIRRDEQLAAQAIGQVVSLARQALDASIYEEAWFLIARAAAWQDRLVGTAPQGRSSWLASALQELRQHQHPHMAVLGDLIGLAAVPPDDSPLAELTQKCWATVRTALASLASTMPAASRWRATAAQTGSLDELSVLSLLDPIRWTDPQQWQRALLPLFSAHPFEWREAKDATPVISTGIKAVAVDGAGAWVVNASNTQDSIARLASDLHSVLWQQPPAWASTVGLDGIRDAVISEMQQLDSTGFFPIVREFNRITRQRQIHNPVPDSADLINLASARLDAAQTIVREQASLQIHEDEMICNVGTLCQIPWELTGDTLVRTARVCLDPRSTGLSRVEIPDVRLTGNSRIAVFSDGSQLDYFRHEADSIAAAFGSRAESIRSADLDSLQQAADRCQVLHIVGHGTQSWLDPRNNALHLGDISLSATELARLDLTQVDLVVVNACDAAAPGPWARTGEASIAGALLAAGAKAVAAALWSVEDSCAAVFASAFYRGLITGSPLLTSFRDSHEELRRHARSIVSGPNSLLSEAYRLLIRGRGLGSLP